MCSTSLIRMGSTNTLVKRFRNDFGNPFLPPPCAAGFCAANTLKVGGHLNVLPSSGTNTSAR